MNNKVSLGALILLLSLISGCNGGSGKSDPLPAPPAPQAPVRCDITLSWSNPTHREPDESGYSKPLEAGELEKLTIYAGRIPLAPSEALEFVMDINEVYILMWTIADLESGAWYFQATVTDTLGQESDRSDEAAKVCE
jgi:hypothetical protein